MTMHIETRLCEKPLPVRTNLFKLNIFLLTQYHGR